MLLPICHREVLSDIFEIIDLDGNGLLSLDEYNFFELRNSGEKCDKDAWAVCKGNLCCFFVQWCGLNRKIKLPMDGYRKL